MGGWGLHDNKVRKQVLETLTVVLLKIPSSYPRGLGGPRLLHQTHQFHHIQFITCNYGAHSAPRSFHVDNATADTVTGLRGHRFSLSSEVTFALLHGTICHNAITFQLPDVLMLFIEFC